MADQPRCFHPIGNALLALGLLVGPAFAGSGDPVTLSPGAVAMLVRTVGCPAATLKPGEGRSLFESVLACESFRSGSVGCFDVHVLATVGGAGATDAAKLRDTVLATLAPAAQQVSRLWPAGGGGLISAVRFPVVLVSNAKDYLQLVKLLEDCERAGYSGWSPANTLDSPDVLAAEVARTWEVQIFDLTNSTIAARRDDWLRHGVGYYSLAFVANRALRKGAWGLVPPWLSSGLTDELDIAAFGVAYVGQESWVSQTPGWSRSGWSGFVPEGSQPPPPIVGPPAELATTVSKTGNPWLGFDASRTRHWSELVADLKTAAPASFARAAQTESFLPRDRAAARCLLHLMLADGTGSAPFTALLDRASATPRNGMPDGDPLPVIFARALGGVPEVDRLETLDTRTLLTELSRPDLIERLEQLRADDALALKDHRQQAEWLYDQSCDLATRTRIFQTFLEIEYAQQMAEWKALGPHLDSGLRCVLKSCKTFPSKPKDVAAAEQAFRAGLAERADITSSAAALSKGHGTGK
jgi:hypothetical protein